MNEKVHEVLLRQRELLNSSSAELQESSYVFPASDGGLRRLDSLKKRFSQLRDLAGIPKEFRPNYCLRDTMINQRLEMFISLRICRINVAAFHPACHQGFIGVFDDQVSPQFSGLWI